VYRRRSSEDLKVVPYNPKLTKRYRCHINVERTQGGGAVAYLMKYTFKPPKLHDVFVNSREESRGASSSTAPRNPARDNIRNDIRLFMRARVTGAVEAASSLFEFRHVRIHPTVNAYTIHLDGERQMIIRNPNLPSEILNDSPLLRYYKRPASYSSLKFLDYMEKVKLTKNLTATQRRVDVIPPRDSGSPPHYVIDKGADGETVARIRFVPPSNSELFSLRIILLHKAVSSYSDAKTVEGHLHRSFRDAAVAMGLYADGNEFEKSFDEAVRMHCTPSSMRFQLVTLYQQGADPERMYNKHKNFLMSDISRSSPEAKERELVSRLFSISDQHGGKLLREIPYFRHKLPSNSRTSEFERARQDVETLSSPSSRKTINNRYNSLNSQQKRVFDSILGTVRSRANENVLQTDGKAFFLQGRAGTGKTYLLSLLRDKARSE